MLAVAALINLLGVPAALWGNELAIRFGLRLTAILLVFIETAIVIGAFGLAALLPFIAAAIAALVVGFIAQGNFSNLTSGLLAVARPSVCRGNYGALFEHRVRWGLSGDRAVWVHARSTRRRRLPPGVDCRLRHLGDCLRHRGRRDGAALARCRARRLSRSRFRLGKAASAGKQGNGRDAPIPVVRLMQLKCVKPTHIRPSNDR